MSLRDLVPATLLLLACTVIADDVVELSMPGVLPSAEDSYICKAYKTSDLLRGENAGHVMAFTPVADGSKAHHMLLHVCESPTMTNGETWDCLSQAVCTDGSMIKYGWAKNADGTTLPDGVSISLDPKTDPYVVLQVHYARPLSSPDYTSLKLNISMTPTKYDANIYLLGVGDLLIPAKTPVTHGDSNCPVNVRMHPFAFRPHAHRWSFVITGYHYSKSTGKFTEIARGNPQWPQAFYPVTNEVTVEPGDSVLARCSYDTTENPKDTVMGPAHSDEMCNLYLMYYVEEGTAEGGGCWEQTDPELTKRLPSDSDRRLPPNPLLEGKANPMGNPDGAQFSVALQMPGALPKEDDSYLCTAFDVKSWQKGLPVFINKFEVQTTAKKVHHFILSACSVPRGNVGEIWDCRHHATCSSASKILYAWAKDAAPAEIPSGVGFELNDKYSHLVMQVHYAHPLTEPDHAGVKLDYTITKPQRFAGIYLMHNSFFALPPKLPKAHADMDCVVSGLQSPLTVFAFRTHAHQHGTVIAGYKYKDGKYLPMAKGDPQKPQAFYPASKRTVIENGDTLVGRCTFSTMNETTQVMVGQAAGDEMCNLYLMFYSETQGQDFEVCGGGGGNSITENMPTDSDVPLTKEEFDALSYNNGHNDDEVMNPKKKKQLFDGNTYYQVNNWPLLETMKSVGQPCGVAIDIYGYPTVFHRGDRIWNHDTFNWDDVYNGDRSKPIPQDTVLTMDYHGRITKSWGSNLFFLPHMITIDGQNNVWVTDVALHQVFKFEPYGGNKKPLVVLGKRFEPGTDDLHYCKPTSVAVMADGKSFFVADGYCNSRIIKYGLAIDDSGYHNVTKLFSWGKTNSAGLFVSQSPYSLNIPHSLALAEAKSSLCVADRENGRVQCYSTDDGSFVKSVKLPEFSSTIYSVDYDIKGNALIVISGPEAFGALTGKSPRGFQIGYEDGQLIRTFNAGGDGFQRPHDICVSKNGTEIYAVDLEPKNVYKLAFGEGQITNKDPHTNPTKPDGESPAGGKTQVAVLDGLQRIIPSSNYGIGIAIFSVSLTVCFTVCIAISRCRKRGRGKKMRKRDRKLDLGDLLGRSKDGFLPLNTSDDIADNLSSESDLDDFAVPAMQKGV